MYLLGSYDVFRCMCTSVWVSECDHVPGLWGRLPDAIVAGAVWLMLVGGVATRCCHQVLPPGPVTFFLYHSFLLWKQHMYRLWNRKLVGRRDDLEEHAEVQITLILRSQKIKELELNIHKKLLDTKIFSTILNREEIFIHIFQFYEKICAKKLYARNK